MRTIIQAFVIFLLAGCATQAPKRDTYDFIDGEMTKMVAESKARPAQPDAVSASLLPPIRIETPTVRQPAEQRFSLAFNNLPANQFFMVLVSGTRYSMLVPPEVTGTISANLKDVTVFEALDAIRELYGYDYKVEGTRIYIKPLTLQSRVFQVNYLTGKRSGSSDIRVTSGSIGDTGPQGSTSTVSSVTTGGGSNSRSSSSSNINTTSTSDFWTELKGSLDAIVGSGKEGRSVVISPQSGVVVVRAMWKELRDVSDYLKATQLSVDRQVILEAKIIEVQLNDSFQSGINWAAFGTGGNSRISAGRQAPASGVVSRGSLIGTGFPGDAAPTAASLGSLFGLAFQTSNFAALISFLESQGTVHVLSSPRIATLNNQKAVLKVGTDEFFVTNVSTTTTTGTATTTNPSVTLQPFFSGVALDVTPQIDEGGNIILHIHPSVSNVTTVNKDVNLGSGGSLILPLASSSISETDSVVRGRDGQVVAIGGLMRQSSTYDRSQLPGTSSGSALAPLLGNTSMANQKRELVILLRPIVVQGEGTWSQDLMQTQRQIRDFDPANLNSSNFGGAR
jgi:MSHA biogenesis protein MshL